ncbi:hypothetical protein CSE_04560 [Caldisericum exile AZM16c01]|uniref:Uncharacterized protein n=1 Tax=Caldisericum exile (strain DSM 21853 / NBRC 104410 / AZM16c01) TaxID=511051 RepID=A0A7U6GDT7_CALEA|nr:hypothetical protein CSE_04560 [Caldisericum exile AZM16c01]
MFINISISTYFLIKFIFCKGIEPIQFNEALLITKRTIAYGRTIKIEDPIIKK